VLSLSPFRTVLAAAHHEAACSAKSGAEHAIWPFPNHVAPLSTSSENASSMMQFDSDRIIDT
jgi:hypothetical protein